MTVSQSNLSDLSRFIFKSPSWKVSVLYSVLIAAVVGFGVFNTGNPINDIYKGIFYIGIPTLVASLATPPIDRVLGGKFTYNRSSLLALTSEIIVVLGLLFAKLISFFLGENKIEVAIYMMFLVTISVIFAFRLAIIMAVSHRNSSVASIPASIQTLVSAILVYYGSKFGGIFMRDEYGIRPMEGIGSEKLIYFQSYYGSGPQNRITEILSVGIQQDIVLLIGMCLVYALGVWCLIQIIDRPWRKSLGISGFDFIRGFIGYIAEDSQELEEFFESIGEAAVVPVTVSPYFTYEGEEKACFSMAMVHPGPMGKIGGGNLPERLANDAIGMVFTPHATAGHDFNLVTEREVDPILSAVKNMKEGIILSETATKSIRKRAGEAEIIGQMFGENAMLMVTYSPGCADDIDYAVGLSAMAESRVAGVKNVMLIDAHNCNNGTDGRDMGHITPGSQRSFDLFEAVKSVSEELINEKQLPFELGISWKKTKWGIREGMGPLGIRVALIKIDNFETAYVQIDGNNMDQGLRDKIIAVNTEVDEIEIITTDTHVVNTVEAVNQIGNKIPHNELIDEIKELIRIAKKDYEPVRSGMTSTKVTVTVFGNDTTETLASHANAVISMSGAVTAVIIIATIAISILMFIATVA
jgi:putative membrane protein